METRRPGMYITLPSTVSCDVKLVFEKKTQTDSGMLQVENISSRRTKVLMQNLQEYDSKINFTTDLKVRIQTK